VIISIDETGFRSDTTQERKWQFISYQAKKDITRPKVRVFDDDGFEKILAKLDSDLKPIVSKEVSRAKDEESKRRVMSSSEESKTVKRPRGRPKGSKNQVKVQTPPSLGKSFIKMCQATVLFVHVRELLLACAT